MLFFFQKKKKTWRPKSARKPSILRWSGGWSFIGDLGIRLFDGASINGVAGGASKKNLQNPWNHRGFGIGIEMSTSQSSFVVDDLISGEFWKIWPDSSGERYLTIPTWPRRRNLCTFLRGYLYGIYWKKHRFLANDRFLQCQDSVYIARVVGSMLRMPYARHRELNRPLIAQVLGFSSRQGHLQPNPQKWKAIIKKDGMNSLNRTIIAH